MAADPQLPAMVVVGTPAPRADAFEKVTGAAQYAADVALPGLLHAALVPSLDPRGRIRSVDTADALALPGVRAVLTAADLTGPAIGCQAIRYGPAVRDRPILADDVVRYVGEPVAVVVAADPSTAREAARLVQVEIDPEPAVLDFEQALSPTAPPVHQTVYEREDPVHQSPAPVATASPNVLVAAELVQGDVDAALARAERVFQATFTFPSVYQYAMEPFCAVAEADDRHLRVWSSQQHPSQVQRDLARLFGYPQSQVQVIVTYVGGGFGSKSFTHVEPIAVAAAKAVHAPVKLQLDVAQSMLVSRRHAATVHVRSGVDAAGRIVAYEAQLYFFGGAYLLTGAWVAEKGAYRCLGGYSFPNYRVRAHIVALNLSPAGSYRAIGGPQASWAVESHMDEVAAALGCDPIELRRRHLADRGAVFRPGRAPLDTDLGADLDVLAALAAASPAPGPPHDGAWRVGSGAALGVADPASPPFSTALVRLAADGSATVLAGSTELGQGIRTALRQVAAETLGVPFERVAVMPTDTAYGPYDASTGASRSTVMSGLAVQRGARSVRDRIAEMAAESWGCPPEEVRFEAGAAVGPDGQSEPLGAFVRAHFGRNGGSFFGVGEVTRRDFPKGPPFWEVTAGSATIAVDAESGRIKLLGYRSIADVGRAINPQSMEGQEEGAAVQGMGHTLSEALVWADGQVVNSSLIDYSVPRFPDVPPVMAVQLIENGDGPGPFGAKGGGEGGVMPVASAVGTALFEATGVRVRDLPLTPERVWCALAAAGLAPDYGRQAARGSRP